MIILWIAFALRMWDIGARSLWFDESIEYWIATSNISDLPNNALEGLNDPPLYVFFLQWWMRIGQGEFFLRFPSVCFSLLSIAGVSVLTRKLFRWRASLIATGFMAILPSEIRYAQEVGEYALMVCGVTFYLLSWTKVMEEHSFRAYIFGGLAALLATYSYFYAVFPIVVSFVITFVHNCFHGRGKFIKQSVGLFLYGVGIVPLVNLFLSRSKFGLSTLALDFTQTTLEMEVRNLLGGTLKSLIGFQLASWPWTRIPEPILMLLVTTIVFLMIVYLSSYPKQWLALLIFTWLAYFVLGRARVFGFRYGLILTPLLIPTIAQSISGSLGQKFSRPVSILVLGGIFLAGVISLPNRAFRDQFYAGFNFPWPEIEDMRQVVEFWFEHRTAEQSTYVYYGSVPAFRYYLKQHGLGVDNVPPMWYAHCWKQYSPAYCRTDNIFYGAWIRNHSSEAKLNSISETLGSRPHRLWIAFSHVYPGEKEIILEGLKEYRVILTYEHAGASLYLLELQ
jgi:hypothetical protein